MNDDAAAEMLGHIRNVHSTISFLTSTDHQQLWWDTLQQLVDRDGLHGLLAGRICRWLFEGERFSEEETALRLERALSPAQLTSISVENLLQAAAWLDGFLREADLLLIHDQQLWGLIDRWVGRLSQERFQKQ